VIGVQCTTYLQRFRVTVVAVVSDGGQRQWETIDSGERIDGDGDNSDDIQ